MLIAADVVGELSSLEAGAALGRGFADRADVAVVPMATGGAALASAVATIADGKFDELGADWVVRAAGLTAIGRTQAALPGWAPDASTRDVGAWIAQALAGADDGTVVIDLTGVRAHDGGAGLLAAARDAVEGREIIGVIAEDERELPATGLTGAVARRGYGAGVDVAEVLAADVRMTRWADSLGAGLAAAPGGGAAGGSGLAVLGLGGRLMTGPQFCHWLAGMDASIAAADLIVTATTSLSALDRGGAVVQAVAGWAEQAQRPCVAFAGGQALSRRELRTFGLESAHWVDAAAAAELTEVAAQVARSWFS